MQALFFGANGCTLLRSNARMNSRGEKVTKGFAVMVREPEKGERQEGRMYHSKPAAEVLCEMMKKAHPDWQIQVKDVLGFDKAQDLLIAQ